MDCTTQMNTDTSTNINQAAYSATASYMSMMTNNESFVKKVDLRAIPKGGNILPLIYDGNPLLSHVSAPYDMVKETIADTNQLYLDMSATMRAHGGVGLAGVQVGVLKRVFVMEIGAELPLFLINPRIVSQEGALELDEGCLSFKKIVVQLMVRFTTISGETVTRKFTGMSAHCVAHECNHLDGITMRNKVSKLKWDMAVKKSKKG